MRWHASARLVTSITLRPLEAAAQMGEPCDQVVFGGEIFAGANFEDRWATTCYSDVPR
jgi:hypothetical protein